MEVDNPSQLSGEEGGGGASDAERSAAGRRPVGEARGDVGHDPSSPEDGGGASETEVSSTAFGVKAGGGVTAPSFSGSYAGVDASVAGASGGRSSAVRGGDRPGLLLDPVPPNAPQGNKGTSLAGGDESRHGALSTIVQEILSWKLGDVMNEDLYRKKVKKVPEHLESMKPEEYISYFPDPVIEDCRANLSVSVKSISSAECLEYHVTGVLETDLDDEYFVDINLDDILDAKKKYHIARDGDLFLFSTLSDQDANFRCSFKGFGLVVGTSAHSHFHQAFKVRMLQKPENINFGYFLMNLSHAVNVWSTLKLYDKMMGASSGIGYIMKLHKEASSYCSLCPSQSRRVDSIPSKLTLSNNQIGITKSLSLAVQCTHKNVVKVVTGPPGSGKTRIVVSMLNDLHQYKYRVLICVPKATSTFQFWKSLQESGYPIGDCIVLDNLKGIKLPKKFHQTCLHRKSYDFRTCAVMIRQWIEEMLILLQLEIYCSKNCHHHESKHNRCTATSLPIFTRSSYRKTFLPLALDMRKDLIELRDKFSNMCLTSQNIEDIALLLDKLETFQKLLFNEAASEEHVQRAFGYLPPLSVVENMIQITSGSCGPFFATELNDARLKFAAFLKTFRNSVVLPRLDNRQEVDSYCIEHSKVIIGTPQSIFQLHEIKNSVDLLIVDDAARIRECDLVAPLCLPVKHLLFFSDSSTSPPMVKSKVCDEAGFGHSFFQRLVKMKVSNIKLDEQFAIEPAIFQFVNSQIYNGKIKNGPNVSCAEYNKHFASLEVPQYCIFDATAKVENCNSIELAGVLGMLDSLRKCWKDVDQGLHIAIVCTPSSNLYAMKDGLISKYAAESRIKLSVVYADCMDGEMFDVVILSAISKIEDQYDLRNINAAITRARHCFWLFIDLSASQEPLRELIKDACDRKCLVKLDPMTLLGELLSSKNETLMVGVESTWNGRPYRRKYVLAPMRNQGNSDTCALHSSLATAESEYKFEYARQEPSKNFDWILCTCDLSKKYKAAVKSEIGDEDIENRGSKRLETVHKILEKPGILGRKGRKGLQPEETKLFNIKSCTKLDIEKEGMSAALSTMAAGCVYSGNFRISRNYFRLKPGEVYHYDSTDPYLNPKTSLPYAHAVMMVGSGLEVTKLVNGGIMKKQVHLNFQNSAGDLFGDKGFGKVGSDSVRSLYRMTV